MRRSATLTLLKLLALAAVGAALLDLPALPRARPRMRLYLVDASASVRAGEGERARPPGVDDALDLIRRDARERLDPEDAFAVIAFAEDQTVTEGEIPTEVRLRLTDATDAAAALGTALGLARPDRINEIVLFSDGRFDDPSAIVRDRGVPVLTMPLGSLDPDDARIESVDHPVTAIPGRPFSVRVTVASTRDREGTLRLGDRVQPVRLARGARQEFVFDGLSIGEVPADFPVVLEVDDAVAGNNGWPFTVAPAERPASVLVLSGFGADSPAARALEGAARVSTADGFQSPDLFDAVVLEEMAPAALDAAALKSYVAEGGTLLMLGGGFLGAYHDTPVEDVLPVWTLPRDDLAVALVLDASGSMTGDRIRAARRRILEAAEFLSPRDQLALVTFGRELSAYGPAPLASRAGLARALEAVEPHGPTRIAPALRRAAEALRGVKAAVRAAILITDGETQENAEELTGAFDALRAEGIGVTAILTTPEATLPAVQIIRADGPDTLTEPLRRILSRARRETIENPTDPPMGRANRTEPRPESLILRRVDGAPLAATRAVGTGRAAVLATALTDEWGGPGAIPIFRELWERVRPEVRGQVVSARFDGRAVTVAWKLEGGPPPAVRFVQGSRRGEARLRLRAPDTIEATIAPVGPGPLQIAGPTRLRFLVPASPELARVGRDDASLESLARLTGGVHNGLQRHVTPGRTSHPPARAAYAALALALFVLDALLAVLWK